MWYLRESGIELMCPALADEFLTSEPPGEPMVFFACLFLGPTLIN